jgi:type II secretory pathway component PulF
METTAKKCVQWGIALIMAGGLVLVLLPQLMGVLAESVGPTASIGVGLVDIVLTLVRWALIPMGTTLIGAAIIIRALAPAIERSRDVHTTDAKI